MDWFPYIYPVLLCLPAGSLESTTLTQPIVATAIPGTSVTLECLASGYDINKHHIHWTTQPTETGLVYIGGFRPRDPVIVVNKFKGRVALYTTGSTSKLRIDGLTAEDTALYYCARGLSGYFDIWGKGTTVVVTSEPAKAPTVFPLSPTATSIDSLSIGCLIKGYFPEPVTVQWNSGAIISGIHNFPPVRHPSGQYTHTSLLTIPNNQWESESFQCNVNHEATKTRINKNIERCEPHEPVAPEVHLLHSSCNPKGSGGTISLVCFIKGFYPEDIDVEWLVGSHRGLLSPYTEPPRHDANTYTFSTNSVVNITQADWMEGNTYYCQVTHAASQTRTKSRARKCEDAISHFSTGVTAYLLPPQPKDLYINRNGKLVCTIVNLQQEEGLKITWSREKQAAVHPGLVAMTEENNGTFTAVGHLPVSAHDWESGETFTCSVEYPSLPGPIVKTIAKSREKSKAPKVHIYPPIPGNSLMISCYVWGFYPSEMDIQWLKNGNAISENNYVNTPAVKEKSGDSYFLFSKLKIPKSSWDNGDVVSCMVVHEALEMKLTQKSIEKTLGKR